MKNPHIYAQIPSDCKQDNFEILQKTRTDLTEEIKAIIQYDNNIHSSITPEAISTWEDIRNEELVHVGELLSLMIFLCPEQKKYIDQGMAEFKKRIEQ